MYFCKNLCPMKGYTYFGIFDLVCLLCILISYDFKDIISDSTYLHTHTHTHVHK